MKNKTISGLAIFVLACSGALSIGARAQTADDGYGPSEQPSAPMEMGQPDQSQPDDSGVGAQADMDSPDSQPDMNSSDAQPTEAQPGGPSGEAPARSDQGVA